MIYQKHLRSVILLCSSSRGGSSITTEFLRQRNDILHLPAEFNPLLHHCSFPPTNRGDELGVADCTPLVERQLWDALVGEIGTYHREVLQDSDWDQFAKIQF